MFTSNLKIFAFLLMMRKITLMAKSDEKYVYESIIYTNICVKVWRIGRVSGWGSIIEVPCSSSACIAYFSAGIARQA
jgi:hypothetical protein